MIECSAWLRSVRQNIHLASSRPSRTWSKSQNCSSGCSPDRLTRYGLRICIVFNILGSLHGVWAKGFGGGFFPWLSGRVFCVALLFNCFAFTGFFIFSPPRFLLELFAKFDPTFIPRHFVFRHCLSDLSNFPLRPWPSCKFFDFISSPVETQHCKRLPNGRTVFDILNCIPLVIILRRCPGLS